MLVYEYLVEILRKNSPKGNMHYKETTVEPWRIAVAGAVAGMTSWLPAIQFDVIKTRMMIESNPNRFKSVWHCYKVVVAVSEFFGLFIVNLSHFIYVIL